MKISIEGNIIDTVDIYKIGAVRFGHHSLNPSGGHSLYAYAEFEICLYNHKLLKVELENDDLKNDYLFIKKLDTEASNSDLMNRINKVRDEIIGYWNEDKRDIINIEIDAKKYINAK